MHQAHTGACVVVLSPVLSDIGQIPPKSHDRRDSLPSSEALEKAGLTSAEIELLPLLADHLSFTEISEVLRLERSTVDSRALSIYRKLGVSPLTDAIDLFADPPDS